MKKYFFILALLTLLIPVRAQETVPKFSSHADFLDYFEAFQMRRAELLAQQESAVNSRRQKADAYLEAAEAETDPDQKQLLLERAAVERRMIGEVFGSIQHELSQVDSKIQAIEEKYKFIYPEAFPYYRDREQYSKEELQDALKKASRAIRRSETGKALKLYINTLK